MNAEEYNKKLSGKSYSFEDGNVLKVIQVKRRDDGLWVIFEIISPGALPRRFVDKLEEFASKYEHLFS